MKFILHDIETISDLDNVFIKKPKWYSRFLVYSIIVILIVTLIWLNYVPKLTYIQLGGAFKDNSNNESKYFSISIPETDIINITEGMPVEVELIAFENKIFKGTVTEVSDIGVVDQQSYMNYYEGKIEFSESELNSEEFKKIRTGMQGQAKFLEEESTYFQYLLKLLNIK